MAACWIIFGIITFISVADDFGLWLFLDRIYNKNGKDVCK